MENLRGVRNAAKASKAGADRVLEHADAIKDICIDFDFL